MRTEGGPGLWLRGPRWGRAGVATGYWPRVERLRDLGGECKGPLDRSIRGYRRGRSCGQPRQPSTLPLTEAALPLALLSRPPLTEA